MWFTLHKIETSSFEQYEAYKEVHPRSAADARAQNVLQGTTYCDGFRCHVGMVLADDKTSLTMNYSALVHFKSLERRLVKGPN